jgi:hypothetical protein
MLSLASPRRRPSPPFLPSMCFLSALSCSSWHRCLPYLDVASHLTSTTLYIVTRLTKTVLLALCIDSVSLSPSLLIALKSYMHANFNFSLYCFGVSHMRDVSQLRNCDVLVYMLCNKWVRQCCVKDFS